MKNKIKKKSQLNHWRNWKIHEGEWSKFKFKLWTINSNVVKVKKALGSLTFQRDGIKVEKQVLEAQRLTENKRSNIQSIRCWSDQWKS